MHVTIKTGALPSHDVAISNEAAEAVRMDFNISQRTQVDVLKALAAAFISACDEVAKADPAAGREAAVAKTTMETAAMWAVKAATRGA